MYKDENINSATGIIFKRLKRINMEKELSSYDPKTLKLVLNDNIIDNQFAMKDYLHMQEESKVKKQMIEEHIQETIIDPEVQKKEILFQKFIGEIEQCKKYADPKMYRAPFQVKTNGLSKCIQESSDWYKQKTGEVIKKDKYMQAMNKFSLKQKQAKPSKIMEQIYQIQEKTEEELQEVPTIQITTEETDQCSNLNSSNQINLKEEEQKYYILNNFPLQNFLLPKPSINASRSSYSNLSKVKRQSSTTNDQSTSQLTQSSLNQQIYKKIYSNDYSQIQDEIGKLQRLENEKEAQTIQQYQHQRLEHEKETHNIQQSQQILANKVTARNMDSLFNMKRKAKNNSYNQNTSQSQLKLNNSEQSISIQGKNIHSFSVNQIKQIDSPFLDGDQLSQTNYSNQKNIKHYENDANEGVTPDRQSPFLQPKMRQTMWTTLKGFSLDRSQSGFTLKRPQSAQIDSSPNKQRMERPQSAQNVSIFAQMGSFPSRSNKKIQIKKGLIKRAQSANPKVQFKNIQQEQLFTIVPIKYTNIRENHPSLPSHQNYPNNHNNPNNPQTQYGNFFFTAQKFSKNQYEKHLN